MLNVLFYLLSSKVVIMFFLINYIVFAVTLCKLSLKANMKNQWVAFIPLLQFVLFLHIIDRSGWYILLLILPFANIILVEVWLTEFYSSFDVAVFWIVMSLIIYPINCGFMMYMSYSPNIKYIGFSNFTDSAKII
jgi:hypothetical protein